MEEAQNEFQPDFDQQRFDEVVTRAWVDPGFRQQLIANSEQTLREAGVGLPENVRVTIHEFDLNNRHLILPPLVLPSEASVDEEELMQGRPGCSSATAPRPANQPFYGIARPFLGTTQPERSENNG